MCLMYHVGILIKAGEGIDAASAVCLSLLGLFALICDGTL